MSDAGVSLDLLRQSLAASVAALAVWREVRDVSGQLVDLEAVDASVGFGAWVGLPPDEVVGRRYSEMIPSGIHSRLPLYLKAMETGDAVTVAFDRVLPDGTEASSEIRAVPFGDGEMFVAMWDVTDTRRQLAETERAHAEALLTRDLLTAALNSSPDAFAIYRVARGEAGAVEAITVEFVNEAAATTTGRTPEAWVGADVRERLSDEGSGGLYEHLVAAVDELVPRRVTISLRMPSGWMGVFDHVISPFGVDRVITNWRPVDRRAGAASATVRAAPGTRTDPLTGLINRGEFRRRLAQWVRDRGPADAAGAVLVVDLDEFGRLNDIVGTHRADAAVATLGAELRALDPWLQLPARIGSDEFAGVLVGPLDAAAVDVARSRLHHVLTRTATLHELPPLSISAGLRVIEPGASVDQLIRDANTALRHATRAGGGTVTVFTEQVRRSLLIDYLEGDDIRRGMVAGEFALALQPIVDIASGSPVGDEALIRWLHSELGLLLPSHFISVAESTDVIVDLGGWVIGEAVARLSTTVGDRQLGINVSGVQLLRSDVPAIVAAALERHRIDAGRLVVEITESAVIPDSARIRDQLSELRQMGVQVAIDDFGSGYSSIAYLDWIPVDVVKLDRRFLTGTLDRRRRALLAASVQLIGSIGARSLCEGIESAEQLDVVREAGVDFGQGYLFGRPALADHAAPGTVTSG